MQPVLHSTYKCSIVQHHQIELSICQTHTSVEVKVKHSHHLHHHCKFRWTWHTEMVLLTLVVWVKDWACLHRLGEELLVCRGFCQTVRHLWHKCKFTVKGQQIYLTITDSNNVHYQSAYCPLTFCGIHPLLSSILSLWLFHHLQAVPIIVRRQGQGFVVFGLSKNKLLRNLTNCGFRCLWKQAL